MKKGLNAWIFDRSLPLRESLLIAKNAGYDGVELNLAASGEFSMGSADSDIRALGMFAKDIGLELPSVCTSLYWQYSLTSPIMERRGFAERILQRQITIAELVGAGHVLCVPGAVGVDLELQDMFNDLYELPFDVRDEIVDYGEAYDTARETLMRISGFARSHNVVICVENVANKFLLSPLEMAHFLDEIGSEWVRMYFDAGNVFRTGYPQHWIRALGERIAMVHLKDRSKRKDCFVKLGDGDTDFVSLRNALLQVGFDGYLTAEYMSPGKYSREEMIFDTVVTLNRIICKGE